ncbi:MAG: acylneuraminate cytidylyltransferase family protein [Pseudomonadota bacterium]
MIDGKRLTALLPMKAHSARVTSKNFREIAGQPLFRWILNTLLSVTEIDRIVINTDAREILGTNGLSDHDYDGRVVIRDRKQELCGDFVSMNLVLEDDIENVESDHFLMTHTTNPLLTRETIIEMINAYTSAKNAGTADSLFTVNELHTRFYTAGGAPINHDPDNLIRTQDLPAYMEENSVCYLFDANSFGSTRARIGKQPMLFPTPKLESIDIDEPADWFIAESLLRRIAVGEEIPRA